jgi:hypothetical protein
LSKIYSGIAQEEPTTFVKLALGKTKTVTVNVVGDVEKPGSYTLPALSTIASAMYLAEGPNDLGTIRAINLYRNGKLVSSFDVYEFIAKGTFNSNVKLEDNDVIYLNNPEANSYLDSSSVTSYYYAAGQVRYTLSESASDTNNRKFVLFNVGLGMGDAPDTELCDAIMPETSKVLKRVIKIAQILIPVLLIGLTSFDVGKIVLAGNIEEELPKQKKKIMGRFIAAVVFFFLPMLVMLLINMIKDSGFVNGDDIKQISCLFEP